MRSLIIGLGMLAGLAAPALAQEEQKLTDKAKKAVAAVKADMDKRNAQGPILLWKEDQTLVSMFPDYDMVVVRFRQFPVARPTPKGLSAANIFAVKDDKVLHLRDTKMLESFFKDRGAPVKSEADARIATTSWLALTQEFHQDGFFRFEVLEKEYSIENSGKVVRGRAVVMQGGTGEIAVTIHFEGGKLAKVTESTKIQAGIRPICQATKLLHADPIVRRIVEQDLLVMGRSARDYLMEQRALADAPLRDAIDRIWRRILECDN